MKNIDLLVNITGQNPVIVERYVIEFLKSLIIRNNLDGVNIFIVLRGNQPITDKLRRFIDITEFTKVICPLEQQPNSLDDTGSVCDWMIQNCGNFDWVTISHFDVIFCDDYFSWLKKQMNFASMIGRHHDGIMSFTRELYNKCKVGFMGVDGFKLKEDSKSHLTYIPHNDYRIQPNDFSVTFDTGELFELIATKFKIVHLYHTKRDDPIDLGKSDYFRHKICGSRSDIYQE